MKIFQIIDEENALLAGILLYYEKAKTCIIELPEYLDEWTAPLLFASYVKKKIYTIPRDISFLWVKERVIPSGRQNIKAILTHHHMETYDEMKFLEISEGRCSQDSLYMSENHTILCFFADETMKKIELDSMKDIEELKKIVNNERLYQSGKIGTGGYFITFNDSIDIQASLLYEVGETMPLKLNDFKIFVQKNILDTTESCNLLECSRQNISYMVNQQKLNSVKEEARGNLYLKGDVLRIMW